jgi:nucleoside-diphosphate-sugar epimerase
MDSIKLKKLLIHANDDILQAVKAMDSANCGIALIVDTGSKLQGVITDGDVRRAILGGTELSKEVTTIMTRDPIVIREGASYEEAKALLEGPRCRRLKSILIPEIDTHGRPVNIYHSSELANPYRAGEDIFRARETPTILLIGGGGYIGSTLTRLLLAEGFRTVVFDRFLYGTFPLAGVKDHPLCEIVHGDTRHIDEFVPCIRRADAVIHLAELVGDPLCAQDSQTTFEINYLATTSIARACAHLQVNRFIYLSSCSVYGASSDPDDILTEQSELNPVSLYAKMKIGAERAISERSDGNFSPCILRLGTVFGLSYRPRFDLVVNTLTARAVTDHRIVITGGQQWRPHIHVRDVAHAIHRAITCDLSHIRGQVFNIVGANHRIAEIGQMVSDLVPDTDVVYNNHAKDQRNYRVSAAKAGEVLGFSPKVAVRDGIGEMAEALRLGRIRDYRSDEYHNVGAFQEAVAGE